MGEICKFKDCYIEEDLREEIRDFLGRDQAEQEHSRDPYQIFLKMIAQGDYSKRGFFQLLNKLRSYLLDEGRFGNAWLSGYQIQNSLDSLHKKNGNYRFLGLIPLDIDVHYFKSIFKKFVEAFKSGKRQFGVIQNQMFMSFNQKGTHWVSYFFDFDRQFALYFDSNGEKQEGIFAKQHPKIAERKKNNYFLLIKVFMYLMRNQHILKNISEESLLSVLNKLKDNDRLILVRDGKRYNVYSLDGMEKEPLFFENKIQHQYRDGNCGTYAIFIQYFFVSYLRKGKDYRELLLYINKNKISDQLIERFKPKIFSVLPQKITPENIHEVKKLVFKH